MRVALCVALFLFACTGGPVAPELDNLPDTRPEPHAPSLTLTTSINERSANHFTPITTRADSVSSQPNWADVLDVYGYRAAVYAVGVYYYTTADDPYFIRCGSGFASYYSDAVWTNAHVINFCNSKIVELKSLGWNVATMFVQKAFTPWGPESVYWIEETIKHPEYVSTSSPDVGLLLLDDTYIAQAPPLLPRNFVFDLRIGQPLGTLGFPGEVGYSTTPNPTFKAGVLSAVRVFSDPRVVLLQYDFDTTGGTSGSMVFDHLGYIVGINSSGHDDGSLSFGVRADHLWEMVDHVEELSSVTARHVFAYPYPHGEYRAFPD